MKAKRIAEITADIANLKDKVSQLSEKLKKEEHDAKSVAALLAEVIAREVAKGAMLYAELSAVISTPEKKNSEQVRKLKQSSKEVGTHAK